MQSFTLSRTDQVFTHIDHDGTIRVFAVTQIRNRALRDVAQLYWTPLEDEVVPLIIQNRGIETPRLRRAMRTERYEPLLYVRFESSNEALLVDGSHTYVARHAKGHTHTLAYLVPPSVWLDYLVEDLALPWTSETLLKSHSGVRL